MCVYVCDPLVGSSGLTHGGIGMGSRVRDRLGVPPGFLNFPPNSISLIQGGREIQNFFYGFLGNFFSFARVGLGGGGEEFSG